MLCHPLRPDRRNPLGFSWPESWQGRAAALPVNEFLISSHLVPTRGKAVQVGKKLYPATLNALLKRGNPSYAFSEEFAHAWRPEARRLTLVRLHAVIEASRDAGLELPGDLPVLVIKEVNGAHAADLVMSLFPRSRMIFLLRDGRDVIDSLLDANGPDGWRAKRLGETAAFDGPEERLEWIREASRDWAARINVCTRAYEAHDPELRRQVRYEDLLADTPGALHELVSWIGLPASEARMQTVSERHSFAAVPEARKGAGKVRRAANPGGWRESLKPEEQELTQEIMGDRLVQLGYES